MNNVVAFGLLTVFVVAIVTEGKSVVGNKSEIPNQAKADVQATNEQNVQCLTNGQICHHDYECCNKHCFRESLFNFRKQCWLF